MKKILLFGAFVCLSLYLLPAQNLSKSSIDVNAGISYPHVDLSGDPGYFGSIGYKYTLSHPVSLRGSIFGGSVRGSEIKGAHNLSFTNNLFGAMVGADFNLLALTNVDGPARYVDPFVFLEGGPLFSNITKVQQVENYGTENYQGANLTYGLGGGVRVYLTPTIDFNSRYSFYSPSMDLLDGHNPSTSANASNDYFSTLQVGINIKLGASPNKHQMWASRYQVQVDKKMAALKAEDEEKEKDVFDQNGENGKEELSAKPSPANKKEQSSTPEEVEQPTANNTSKKQKTTPGNIEPGEAQKSSLAKEEVANNPTPSVDQNKSEAEPAQPIIRKQEEIKQKEVKREQASPEKEVVTAPEAPGEEFNIFKTGVKTPSGNEGDYKYYVIVGSFSKLENAENFITDARNSESMEIITDNGGQLFRVSASKTNDLDKALRMKSLYKNQIDPETWVLENAGY